MRLPILAAALWLCGQPLWAEESWGFAPDTSVGLAAMLGRVPASLLAPGGEAATLTYVDLAAARGLEFPGGARLSPALRAAGRAVPPGGLQQAIGSEPEVWRASVGFTVDDIAQLVWFESLGVSAGVFVLAPRAAAAVPAVLDAGDYAREDRAGGVTWAVGEDDTVDFAAGRRGGPFRTRIGRSARVQIDGALLRFGQSWAMIAALAEADAAPASDDPQAVAMREMLDEGDYGALLGVVLMPEAEGVVPGGRDALPDGQGVPVWRTLWLADFSTGPMSTAMVVLSADWPATAPLEPLERIIATRWREERSARHDSYGALFDADPEIRLRRWGAGQVVVSVAVTLPTRDNRRRPATNRALEVFHADLARREGLGFLP